MTDRPELSDDVDMKRRNDAQTLNGWDRDKVTEDAFLGGRLRLFQPRNGFRAGLDSVMLAAAVPAQNGETIADLGSGVGTASLCLMARVPGLNLTVIEIDQGLVELANANFRANKIDGTFHAIAGDALALEREIPRNAFDHVLTNPPFLDSASATTGPDQGKARAIAQAAQSTDLWYKTALALLKPKGTLTLIQRADMLSEILQRLEPGTGDIEVLPLYASPTAPAIRVIIRARKGRRGPLRILPPLILHQADGSFTSAAEAVLRNGCALITSP